MARYRLVQEDRGCCNLVIWDFLLTLAAVGVSVYFGFEKSIHPALCFIIGLIGAFVMVALMNIRVLGKILQILLSAFWAFVAMSLVVSWFHPNTLWQIVIFAVLLILLIGLHMISADEMGMGPSVRGTPTVVFEEPEATAAQSFQADADVAHLTKRYQKLRQQRESIMEKAAQILRKTSGGRLQIAFEENNRVWQKGSTEFSELVDQLEHSVNMPELYATIRVIREYLDRMEAANEAVMQQVLSDEQLRRETNSSSGGFDPFAGCNTLEKLEQRYRQLAKSFHPDTENGDTESMQFINAEYERRRRQFRE